MKRILSFLFVVLIVCGFAVNSSAKTKTTTTTTNQTTSSQSTSSGVSEVAVPTNFKAIENYNCVNLSWKRNKNVKGYIISRSTDKEKWNTIKKTTKNSTIKFTDTDITENQLYYYSIKAYKTINKKTVLSKQSVIVPIFFGINFYVSSYEDNVVLNWSAVKDANGYEIYYSNDGLKFKRLKRIKDNSITSFTKTGLEKPYLNKNYFYLKVYKTVNNKRNYFYQSETINSTSLQSVINGSVNAPKENFRTYNVQGKKAYLAYKTKITDNDKKIFNNFNKEYFASDMSVYYRIYYTFMFIHKKVTYASGSLWNKIGNSTYADAIFNKRLGQCAQYNGAMVEYLANLGFNARVIWGYRGRSNNDRWQHFWGQVKLKNGKTYVIETGNYGNDGNWNYFFKEYKDTKKYLKCGKYVSGIKA
ncbi:MAG: hypothetical protein IIU65_05425 [Clostridia bacterium]|nr:hypothetical protein [Clostridia bacterium]